jgi:hypothetical protein
MKQRLRALGELFWKPFDEHFRDCLESFRKGKRILEREFNAAAMGMMMARHDALDDQIKVVEKLSRRQLDELEGNHHFKPQTGALLIPHSADR